MGFESYGGASIFGVAVSIQEVAHPNAQQLDSFFGVSGATSLYGGGRGRVFMISGVLVSGTDDLTDLNTAESILRSFADGIARTLVDTRGRAWDSVIFDDSFQADPGGPKWSDDYGWILPYRLSMTGLT